MSSCMKQVVVLGLIVVLGSWGIGLGLADEGPVLGPRTIVVALQSS